MNFLKTKMSKIYDYTRSIIVHKQPQATSKKLLQSIFTKADNDINIELLQKLSELSFNEVEYSQIFNFLLVRLQDFSYDVHAIRNMLRALDLVIYLLKNGASEFSRDFGKNVDLFQKLEKVNVRFFQNSHPKNIKELQYMLEQIRHRSKYVQILVKDSDLLANEKKISQTIREKSGIAAQEGLEPVQMGTAIGLNIDIGFQKVSPRKDSRGSKKKIQKQNVKNQQSSMHNLIKSSEEVIKLDNTILSKKIENQL